MRETLELLYFVSGIIVALAASIGLYQLILTKRIAARNSRREAYTLASQQCQFYLNQVIPLLNSLDAAAAKLGITSFGDFKVTRSKGSFSISSHASEESMEHFEAIAPHFTSAMNAVEAFAVHFTTGVAADLPAFSCVSKTFCTSIEKLLPHLAPLASNGYYTNSVKLYGVWSSRHEIAKLEKQKAILEKKRGDHLDFTLPSI